ncbi:DUF4426 domain-containing protein [Salinimonas marina]|nr:DUF4426 domain-containing protein [Salinimonas marina]
MVVATFGVQAEQKKTLGDWDVHYIVVNTAFLTPDVAKAYDIVRSKYSALVNVSVLNKQSQQPQRVDVTGTATNLLGSAQQLKFRRVEDGDAIYYLAILSFDNLETFRFNIRLQQGDARQTLKFQQKLYTD